MIYQEEDVKEALNVNILKHLNIITSKREPKERFKCISVENGVKGDPDFIYRQPNKILLAVEVKMFWSLKIGELVTS